MREGRFEIARDGWRMAIHFTEVLVKTLTMDTRQWAKEQFEGCNLGDARRTSRAVEFAAQIASDASGSTPRQAAHWSDCKAAYRLVSRPEVTFPALTAPHYQQSRAAARGHCLLLGDTTEIEFGIWRKVKGLGPTGDGGGRGFFLHSSLIVGAQNEEIVGLAGQEIFYRKPRPKGESRNDRVLRRRESEVWGRVIDQVGPSAQDARYTHVFDRGADNFEVYCHLLQNRADWVIRAAQLNRIITTPAGVSCKLNEYLATLPLVGSYELSVRAQKDQPARTAKVEVRVGQVSIPAPKHRSPWLRACGIRNIAMWVVEVREQNPPKGVPPLRWVLYTSHAVKTFEDAWRVIGYYEKRSLIEEYHKALKTGCRVEERQYRTAQRLEAITGFLAIMALRLLQLKSVARTEPDRPAEQIVPQLWIDVLQIQRRQPKQRWTVRKFFRELAGLGGFLGRKSDGEPGWLTIWRGFDKLIPALKYAHHINKCG
jgi:Transposase DNA-binding/Transposase Tn5 dimerisation domain